MNNKDITQLNPEELTELLVANLSDCIHLVSVLSKKSALDPKELRETRNKLMLTRSKVRNLAKVLEDMKKPVNAFYAS